MDGFVATGRPAGAFAYFVGVVDTADQDGCAVLDLLEMALETQVGIALQKHFRIDAAVRRMAGRATFVHRFVFKNKGALLRFMALRTIFLL